MKFIAIDEINHFEFHDAQLQKIDFHDGNMTWQLSSVNATTQNSQNNSDKDLCIDQADIVFENINIVEIVFSAYKVYNSKNVIIESVEARKASPNEYSDILTGSLGNYCYILSMKELPENEDKSHTVCFTISGGIGDYFLTLSFSKSIVQWDEYSGEAWYEAEEWKK